MTIGPLSVETLRAPDLLASLDRSVAANDWRSPEQVVTDAVQRSDSDIVVPSSDPDVGADLAV